VSDTPIFRLLEDLPSSGLTPMLLGALDYLVPGEWQNITSFEEMIKSATGEEDQELIQKVGERALTIYAEESGYRRAVQIFQLVDDESKIAGAAALANKLGDKVAWLEFMKKVTPKPDTTQAIDAAVKLVAELATFCAINGIPGDSVSDFAGALAGYAKEDSMRLAGLIAFDCVLPFGPDFLELVLDKIQSVSEGELSDHGLLAKVGEYLPGDALEEKRSLVRATLDQAGSYLTTFVADRGLTREEIFDKVRGYLEIADDKLDYVAATIDVSCNYFEHTGIQTVSRRLITRAYGEI
jgi:hypothetical protein